MPFVAALQLGELPDGAMREVEVAGTPIALYHVGDDVFATQAVCTHALAHLADGTLLGTEVQCPQHGGRFDLRTGKSTRFPAFKPVKTYPVKLEGGAILVDVGSG